MIDAFYHALTNLFSVGVFTAVLAATLIAIIAGVIPGVSGGTAIVILLPFIFGTDPNISLALLTTLTAVSCTGGSLTAVLIGVPGDGANAATVLDGYSMTRKGEGMRACGAALCASAMGGVGSVALAFAAMPLVIPMVMSFRAPELFFLIVMGLSFLAVLTRGSAIKGLISAGIGLVMSTIGYQSVTGVARFNFGIHYLYDGIEMVVVIMGCFAVPVLIDSIVEGETIAPINTAMSRPYQDMLRGGRDVIHHWWLWLRCTFIGYIVGVIPGIGGETAIWVSYAHAKQTSKHPEKFGAGVVEGVIAPESANNAKDGGAILTTLAFGIPGSGVMVLILAALFILGLQPGPKFLMEHPDLSFLMLLSSALSNVLAGIICFAGAPYLVKITRIPPSYLFAILLPVICIAVYVRHGLMFDLLVLVIVTCLAILMRRFGYALPPLVLGFIMGEMFESHFWHSVDMHGPLFFLSHISLVLIFITMVILSQKSISSLWGRWKVRIKGVR
jgi:putative tricarboxylic transport membrane protein